MPASRNAVIASRVFAQADQTWFAQLSGDWNPMHVDAVAARRTQAGEPAVHGVHGLLWGLDALCGAVEFGPVASLKVQFEQFVHLGRKVDLSVVSRSADAVVAHLTLDGAVATVITLTLGDLAPAPTEPLGDGALILGPERQDIHVYAPTELAGLSGRIAHAQSQDAFARGFPHLAAKIGALRVASLATITRLVGMVSPGLHSIFMGMTVDMVAPGAPLGGVRFAVTRADRRFRHVAMTVSGDGVAGSVECLVRMPPVQQAAMADLMGWVADDAFAGKTALIIGGSRGLGELTAKLVAAGGGNTIVSYAVGQDDAARVAEEINRAGGQCATLRLDVRNDVADQLAALPSRPTHFYYFASARIARQKSSVFSPELLAEFMDVYADAFHRVCIALQSPDHPVKAFYPSTVFVDERPRNMTEYAMAKSAGEVLCDDINAYVAGVQVTKQRLPRMLTDQTASAIALGGVASAVDVLKPLILHFQSE